MRTWSEWKAQLCSGRCDVVSGDDWMVVPGLVDPNEPQAPVVIRPVDTRVLALAVVCPTRACDLVVALRLGAELALGAPIIIGNLFVLRHVVDPAIVPAAVADRELALLALEAVAMRRLLLGRYRADAGDGGPFAAYSE